MTHRTHSIALVCVLALAATARDAAAALIPVTTLVQKISSTGGCSLQEAIYSSILQTNQAIDSALPDHFIVTQCVPGTGNDTIVLPTRGLFQLSSSLDTDAYNFMGPTATPIIFSTITIEGNGATLEWTGTGNARLFAVGPASIAARLGTVSGTGNLTLKNVYVSGFHVKGGDGADGGGGGLGAGGAIYVMSGSLTVENSTFDGNSAIGGNGAPGNSGNSGLGGGGGGLAGNGGRTAGGGGGGGGSRGNGGTGTASSDQSVDYGGGGGGTVSDAANASATAAPGGALCGGSGGLKCNDGAAGQCPGGGGGGSGLDASSPVCANGLIGGPSGGDGNYDGGGGAGRNNGGNGGFGGGGGAGLVGHGGLGGFGGGGGRGSGSEGADGGAFGGRAKSSGNETIGGGGGGGGAALGGAIFNDSGTVTVENSTFTNNFVDRGTGAAGADNGADGGGAIFSRNGSLTLVDATINGNQSTGSGGGIVVYEDGSSTSFTLDDTIIANNGTNECFVLGSVTAGGVANLIMSNGSGDAVGACPGVVTNGDPQLGPLQLNQGFTPTLAISQSSAAFNAADAGTSLAQDQRGQARPALGGFDIGAFELCLTGVGIARMPCIIPGGIVQTEALTIQVSPAEGGSTTPAAGSYNEALNSVIVLTALPNPGYAFANWTGNVADPSSAATTVTMDQQQTVTANFVVALPSPTLSATPRPSPTATQTPAATPTGIPCAGDCDGSGEVTVDEIITMVNIDLGLEPPSACPHGIPTDTAVDVTLIIRAVSHALTSCAA